MFPVHFSDREGEKENNSIYEAYTESAKQVEDEEVRGGEGNQSQHAKKEKSVKKAGGKDTC